MQTEGLLKQSQQLAAELQTQQKELQQTNEQLEQKAQQLAEQNVEVERKNQEIEQARRALEEKAAELALTSKYKSEFLANMSHELRTPLNSILILGQQLADNPEGNLVNRQVEFARTIHSAGTDLLNLITDILDLSKIESGTVTVDVEDVSFSTLIDMVSRIFSHEAETRGLSFEVQVDSRLGRSLVTDPKRLQQVLKNLLSNAFKFTSHGGVRLNVAAATSGWSSEHPILERRADGGRLRGLGYGHRDTRREAADRLRSLPAGRCQHEPEVRRNGPRPRHQPRTGESARRRDTAAQHAGRRQHVHAVPACPVCRRRSSRWRPTRSPACRLGRSACPSPARRSGSSRPCRTIASNIAPGDAVLLIVEDDPHYARILVDLARDRGLKVLVAHRGADALALAREYPPTAVSLDVFLPDMLGWTVLSQLKQDPGTRHIPVQIVTLDEDRQHGLARGAFSFVAKPTTTEALGAAIARIQSYVAPRRKRLLIVEDNAAEQLSIRELLGDKDIDIVTADTGHAALAALRDQPCDCVVLDLKLPDMSGFEVLQRIGEIDGLADLPVVVFTGRELSPDEDAQLHSLARSVVVKGVESPERLLDETSLFLHRVVTELPPDKQRMLERLHRSDEDLVGKSVLVVDDDVRNIFALSSVLERRGMKVLTANTGQRSDRAAREHARRVHGPDGHHDAGDGRLPDHADHPAEPGVPPPADRRAHRQGDERRSREVPRGGRIGLPGQACQHRAAPFGAAPLASPLRSAMTTKERVNILLVDDQPSKLLTYEEILKDLDENLIKATSASEALQWLLKEEVAVVLVDVCMPDLDGYELATMIRNHPRHQRTSIIFVSAVLMTDLDLLRGYEKGAVDYVPVPVVPEILRAKVSVFADLHRKTRAARTAERAARGARGRAHVGARGGRTPAARERITAPGRGSAQGRVPGDARARAAQSARAHQDVRAADAD